MLLTEANVLEAEALLPQGAAHLARLAKRALLQEAVLTPKPALVDKRGSGAHHDLDLKTMAKSALALHPFFEETAQISWGRKLSSELRAQLTDCGRRAELAMLAATGGSNAHKGAIWCLGLLLAAAAMQKNYGDASSIAQLAASLARMPVTTTVSADASAAADAAAAERYTPAADTGIGLDLSHGQLVQENYGFGGARAEAEAGFPQVVSVALPYLRQRRTTGRSEPTCQIDTLLTIMSRLDDTCLLYRGGLKALSVAKLGALEILALDGCASVAGAGRLARLDSELVALNASPGGSADLLAATLFLDSLLPQPNIALPDTEII